MIVLSLPGIPKRTLISNPATAASFVGPRRRIPSYTADTNPGCEERFCTSATQGSERRRHDAILQGQGRP